MLLGAEAVAAIRSMRVIVFGVGGVGSWCAEALARTGFGTLAIVDPDVVCASNVNRQLQATSLNLGKPKVEEMAARLKSINPELDIIAIRRAFDETSWADFELKGYDFVIDAIDDVRSKVLLIEKTLEAARENAAGGGASTRGRRGPMLLSSMGAAAKRDPTRVKVAPLSATSVCPLARIVRRELKKRGAPTDFICVYSDEAPARAADPPREAMDEGAPMAKKRVNGSLAHVTGIFGLMLAGLAVNAACGLAKEAAHDRAR